MEENSEVEEAETAKIRVVARVRPFNAREVGVSSENIIEMSDNTLTIRHPEQEIDSQRQFQFDSCHWSLDGFVLNDDGVPVPDGPNSRYSGQEAIFKDIGLKSMEAAWQGYNTAVIAYGMTGSGKSFTMLGQPSDPGLVYRCCRQLFSEIERNPQNKYKVTLSLLELYNEQVIDLLSKTANKLQIREAPSGVYVRDLTVMVVKSAVQTEEMVHQALRNRMIVATNMNSSSSRSHLVVTVRFQQFITEGNGTRNKRWSLIRFVDLAGSERSSKTGTSGRALAEGSMINLSLSGLGAVISVLARQEVKTQKRNVVPYRNSKITRLLKDELGGSCVTTIIASFSPSSDNYDETLSTLRFVSRAGAINHKLKVNDLNVDVAVKTWEAAIAKKETQLLSASSEEEKTELEKSIEKNRLCIRQLEAPWMELESKEKSITWWSTTVNLQQQELETTPYLQNISEDSLLSGVTKHVIPEGHILAGKSESDKVGIHLSGLGIQGWHAIIVNTGTTLSIAPCSSRATVHVNGRPIYTMKEIGHMNHIKLGACELFIVIGFPDGRTTGNANGPKHTYEKCLTEVAENHRLTPIMKPPTSGNVRAETAAFLMFQEFTDLLQQVAQAYALAATFGKNIGFDVEVKSDGKMAQKLYVKVSDNDHNMEWLWQKAKFEDRKLVMDELYENFLSTGKTPEWNQKNNPFYDMENLDVYLGRCKVSLHNIAYMMPVDNDMFVLDFRGRQGTILRVTITPSTSDGQPLDKSLCFQDPKELIGKPLHLRCALPRFSNVLWVAANPRRGIYCKLWLDFHKDVQTSEVVYGTVSGKFQNTFHFAFEKVTQTELNFLQTNGLKLELWGTQAACLPSPLKEPSASVQASPSSTEESSQSNLQPSEEAKSTTFECVSSPMEPSLENTENTQQITEDTTTATAVCESSPIGPSPQIQNTQQDTEDTTTTTAVHGSSPTEQSSQNAQQDSLVTMTTMAVRKSLPTEQSLQNAKQDAEDNKTTTAVGEASPTEQSSQNTQQDSQGGQTTTVSGCASSLPMEPSTQSTEQASADSRMVTDSGHTSLPAEQSSQSALQDSQDNTKRATSEKGSSENAQQNWKNIKTSSSMCVCM